MANRNQTNFLISILIIVLGLIAGYFYSSQSVPGIELELISQQDDKKLDKLSNFRIDFSVLDDDKFRSLEVFGEVPVNPGVTGRKDIFAPI